MINLAIRRTQALLTSKLVLNLSFELEMYTLEWELSFREYESSPNSNGKCGACTGCSYAQIYSACSGVQFWRVYPMVDV